MLNKRVWVMLSAAGLLLPSVASAVFEIQYDADGTKTLSQDGWTLAGTPSDQFVKSKDYSSGLADGTTNGVWNINDNNQPGNAYMKMYKDPTGLSSSRGMIIARVKALGGGSTNGTFGYSSAAGNHSAVMAIRPGAINWKTAEGHNTTVSAVSLDTTSDYRAYAISYVADGVFNSWYSLTNDWSANQADWVQAVTAGTWEGQSALIDETNTARDGLLMGSFGSSGTSWNGNVDWIRGSSADYVGPWAFVPEPASLLLLGLGALFVTRRRQA